MIHPQKTVSEIVLDHVASANVFHRNRIDFCCNGGLSLQEACDKKKLDPAAIIEELKAAISRAETTGADMPENIRQISVDELIDYIVSHHHSYMRESLPFVQTLAAKVARVHGPANPNLIIINECVQELAGAIGPHLESEETDLFPLLKSAAQTTPDITNALSTMFEEHLEVGALLEKIRDASDNYQLPPWACNSYRALFGELANMEQDIHRHIHLENHLLMPKFLA